MNRMKIVLLLLLMSILLAGCAGEDLPDAVQTQVSSDAQVYYSGPASFPETFDSIQKIKIRDFWRAENPPEQSDQPEMWCVELEISGFRQGELQKIREIWAAVYNPELSAWQSAALKTFSSLQAYERCGITPE